MKIKIKAIIFDVGGVLFLAKNKKKRKKKHILSSFREACILLKEIKFDMEKSYEPMLEIYYKSSAKKISKKETFRLLSKELGISPQKTEKAFRRVYKENTVENKKLYDSILKLKRQGYKLGICSIQTPLSRDVVIPRKYHKNFDAMSISCDNGFRKTDPRAFKFVLKKLHVKSKESVFIDDQEKQIVAAKKLGLKAILFENNKQLFKDLKKLGIK